MLDYAIAVLFVGTGIENGRSDDVPSGPSDVNYEKVYNLVLIRHGDVVAELWETRRAERKENVPLNLLLVGLRKTCKRSPISTFDCIVCGREKEIDCNYDDGSPSGLSTYMFKTCIDCNHS